MADTKLSALTALAATPAVNDELYIRDVSEAAANESKRITMANLLSQLPAVTLGGSITGAAQTMTGMGTIALNTGQYVGMDATSKITFTANAMAVNVGSGAMSIATTGGGEGLSITESNDGVTGPVITLTHLSATPAANDKSYFLWRHRNSTPAYFYSGYFGLYLTNVTAAAEESRYEWNTLLAGADNQAMTLSGAGGLAVDLDNGGTDYYVSLFDDYDDAVALRKGIQENNRELLADMGVLDRKESGSGYMMKIQPMVRLLAGGIYQTRALIDGTREELIERIETLENKLMLLGAG